MAQQVVDSRVYVEWPDLEYQPERYIPQDGGTELATSADRERRMKDQFWYKVTLTLYNDSETECVPCLSCCKHRPVVTNE